jgi:vanadium chloroperoxidase
MDSILFWNDVALEANRVSHTNGADEQTGPTLSSRALGIVHLAMYDAYANVRGNPSALPAYLPSLPPPPAGASADAAVAGAAHRALGVLFPSQQAYFDGRLALAGNVIDPGHAHGVAIANALLADRASDPSASDAGYVAQPGRGRHRPDPDNPQGFHAPFYGARSKCFAVTKRHDLDAPPFDNAEYREAVKQVLGKGVAPALMGTLPNGVSPREATETLVGIYWGYDGAAQLGTPPRLYNQIVREVIRAKGTTTDENARLLALVNAAMADAGILAWDQKYIHDLWRPVVGIREHDTSMGPDAAVGSGDLAKLCDPGWLPLGAPSSNSTKKNFTPPFPAYPSGHATFGAAALHVTRLFFGTPHGDRKADKLFKDLTFVSDEFNGETRDNAGTTRPRHVRRFKGGLWQMIEENGESRVFLGVHWVFDAFALRSGKPDHGKPRIGGVGLGLRIAEDIFNKGRNKGLKKSPVGPRTP